MYVKIGPYKNWLGPYHLVEKLFWFLSEDTQEKIVEKIPNAPFVLLEKLRGERKVKVRIDNYDTWNMDTTLAHIIVPLLKKHRSSKMGTPKIDKEDVPEHLLQFYKEDHPFCIEAWNWIIDEMIWSFEQKLYNWEDQYTKLSQVGKYEFDTEAMEKHQKRMQRGFMLFGKYYESLWD